MSRLEQLHNFLTASPDEPFILFALAKEYEKANDLPQALTYYVQLRATTPQYVGLYYHLGKLFEKIEQPEKAMEVYKTGMTVAKQEKDMHAYSELAGAKMNLGDEDEE